MINVCEILGTEYPIIQGAMARIAECNLAAAVSNGGGLGIIASGGESADWLRDQIAKVREMTDKPFGVNIMLLADNVEELIDVVCEEKVPVVTTGGRHQGRTCCSEPGTGDESRKSRRRCSCGRRNRSWRTYW